MFDKFITDIKELKPFTFIRFGDGEWNAIFQKKGRNCDGHQYFPEMGVELLEILKKEQRYLLGLQNLAIKLYGDKIEALNLGKYWVNADVFHKASIRGDFVKFFEALEGKEVLILGPEYLSKLKILYPKIYWQFYSIPERDCWLHITKMQEVVESTLLQMPNCKIVLFVASMTANVLIDRLFDKFGETHILLDMGSVFDPYVGVSKRSYHKDIIQRESGKWSSLEKDR